MDINQEESEFQWYKAARSYERHLALESKTDSSRAELWEKIGFCYGLGSRQAGNSGFFRKLTRLSIQAYEKAAQFFEMLHDLFSEACGLQCFALAEYQNSLITSSPEEKKERLEKSISLEKQALKIFKRLGDESNSGKACNLLASWVLDLHGIISTSAGKIRVIQDGLDYALDAIEIFSKIQNKDDLITSFSLASILSVFLSEVCVQENNKNLSSQSFEFSEEALNLCKQVENPYSKAMAFWARANYTIWFEEQIEKRKSLEFPEEMLRQASLVGDNYLIGMAYHHLAYALYADIREEADLEAKKKKYEEIIEFSKRNEHFLQIVCQDSYTAITYMFYAESFLSLAKEFSITRSDKFIVMKKALKTGKKGVRYGRRSGSPFALQMNLIALSRIYQYYSLLEPMKSAKKNLLNKALRYRKEETSSTKKTFPNNSWYTGVGMVEVAQIDAELAKLGTGKKSKASLFEEAITYMKLGIIRCNETLEFANVPAVQVRIADYEDMLGEMFEEHFSLMGKKEHLSNAIDTYLGAAENFGKCSLPSRAAECFWKIAKNQDRLGDFDNASKSFEAAYSEYKLAGARIPQFNDFYLDYASYVKAWSEIEKAKSAHSHEDYLLAKENYENASNFLKQTKLWNHLSLNFQAWSLLENAEDLSRKDQCTESIRTFQQAVDFFGESKKQLISQLEKIEKNDEKDLAKLLIEVSGSREQFSRGRIAIEEAKLLDRQSDHISSSEKYVTATEIFRNLIQTSSAQICTEAKPLYYLCLAWEKLTMAEARASSEMYEEASDLFKIANKFAINESSSLIALAHSSFCKAMAAGTKFETTRNMAFYTEAKKSLDTSANYYLKAGFKPFSEYAKATQCLFDAYFFMNSAKKETDPSREAKYYLMAEKVLNVSSKSFTEANYSEKANQVERILSKVKEEKELALSLNDVLNAPVITSSTASVGTLSLVEEKAVGLERFAHADIQARIVDLHEKLKVGEYVNVKIQIVNTGKEPVLLTKIEHIAPDGFQVIGKPDGCVYEETDLVFSDHQLGPLKTDEISVVLRAFRSGLFIFKPRIICIDQTGRKLLHDPDVLELAVSGALATGKLSTGFSDLDDLLLGGIPENYAVVLSSPSNDEREILINDFLEAGVRSDQVTFYLTSESGETRKLAEENPSTFFLFICSPITDTGTKGSTNIFRFGGVENLTEINIAILKALRTLDPSKVGQKRFCLGILSDVLLQHQAVITRKWLGTLLSDLKSRGFTTLGLVNRQMHPQEEVEAVIGLFEGEIQVFEKQTYNGIRQFLRIRRLSKQRYLENEILVSKEMKLDSE